MDYVYWCILYFLWILAAWQNWNGKFYTYEVAGVIIMLQGGRFWYITSWNTEISPVSMITSIWHAGKGTGIQVKEIKCSQGFHRWESCPPEGKDLIKRVKKTWDKRENTGKCMRKLQGLCFLLHTWVRSKSLAKTTLPKSISICLLWARRTSEAYNTVIQVTGYTNIQQCPWIF